MSDRDWKTVGVDAPDASLALPGWTIWAVVPVIAPLADMV